MLARLLLEGETARRLYSPANQVVEVFLYFIGGDMVQRRVLLGLKPSAVTLWGDPHDLNVTRRIAASK